MTTTTTTATAAKARRRRAPVSPSTAETALAHDLARQLSLTGLAPVIGQACADATIARATYPGFLAAALQVEVDIRHERRRLRRIAEARLPRLKTLPAFDATANPHVTAQTLALLASGTFITASEPVVLLGDSGTGKSHLLIGTCIAAAENGHRVRYVTCAQLANELAEAADDLHLSKTVARYGRFELLAIDELGYVRLDQRAAELLFQILTEREERASIAIASNSPFSEWGKTFTDTRLAAAVIDRITYRAHIIETGTHSYRLATATKATK
ncbi:MAG: IS21-like element helper ATPase IstB [Candidatus Nanopelagicales bacterium]